MESSFTRQKSYFKMKNKRAFRGMLKSVCTVVWKNFVCMNLVLLKYIITFTQLTKIMSQWYCSKSCDKLDKTQCRELSTVVNTGSSISCSTSRLKKITSKKTILIYKLGIITQIYKRSYYFSTTPHTKKKWKT